MKSATAKLLLTLVFVLLILVLSVTYGKEITLLVSNPEKFRNWINSFGSLGVLIFISIQVFQVVVFVIPGEVVQVAGGYLYGTILGTLYSVIGITLGSLICFSIARILGYDFVKNIVSEEKLKKFDY
ncbi:MAG TPA: TVP38/TMEM64 family protein, partial [Caldanaerobacter subterraneus]